jgi:hypothetical protein
MTSLLSMRAPTTPDTIGLGMVLITTVIAL